MGSLLVRAAVLTSLSFAVASAACGGDVVGAGGTSLDASSEAGADPGPDASPPPSDAGAADDARPEASTQLYTVGGTVTGLEGKDLVLRNGTDAVTVNANGPFAFPKLSPSGTAYAVTVDQQPTNKWQTCAVTASASGILASANVTNVAVACTTNTYALSVDVTGLAGDYITLRNGADALYPQSNGMFTFATQIQSGAEYDVVVGSAPTNPWQTCTVSGGKGKMAGAAVVLDVACAPTPYAIGGILEGLRGNGLVLQDNGGDDLTLNAADIGVFAFATKVASGSPYAVTVKTQPTGVAGEHCIVLTGKGTVANADVTKVYVRCGVEKKVFVTSEVYGPNLGGLDGADAKCQALADAAGLPGTYRAWLSDDTGSPATRFTRSTVPYRLVNGFPVANDWDDLVDGALTSAISRTETGGVPPASIGSCRPEDVFSNTNADGTPRGTNESCTNWTGGGSTAAWGRSSEYSSFVWTYSCSGSGALVCSGAVRSKLYCFQQ